MEEDFKAECNENEVILMQSALFGRMIIGRCIKSNLGFLGCHTNVLFQMDELCSGRQRCQMLKIGKGDFDIADLTGNNCHSEIFKYLEVQHTCVPGKGTMICFINTQNINDSHQVNKRK